MWRNFKLNRPRRFRGSHRDEGGAVLLLVLLVMTLISVLVLSWAQEWRTELQLAANFRESHQCRRLAEAGVYYALGKLLEAKIIETSLAGTNPQELAAKLAAAWPGDQGVHQLKLPAGSVEVRVEDEGGKLNLNQINEEPLGRLFAALGFSPDRISIMVDSILDWRSRGEQPRSYGAKSAYYLRLEPPYVSRNGLFEAVEELAWVRGFEASPMINRFGEYLTVAQTGQGVNINTAPQVVLQAVGLPPDVAQEIVLIRQRQRFTNFQDISMLNMGATQGRGPQLTFVSSPFFTIKSSAMINKKGGRHKIKALVRLDISMRNSWEIISWVDDFPG